MASSSSESDISDSEINGYKRKSYDRFKFGKYKLKSRTGKLRCPFSLGRKKQDYEFNHLVQHARGIGGVSSKKNAKEKAKHLALAMYLDDWLDKSRSNQQNSPGSDYDSLINEHVEQGLLSDINL